MFAPIHLVIPEGTWLNPVWPAPTIGCTTLAHRCRHEVPPSVTLREIARLVGKATGREVNLALMAQDCGVDERTTRRWALAIRRYVVSVERPGMATIEPLLQAAGVVESAWADAESLPMSGN